MGFRPGSTMPSATPYSNFPSKQKRFLLLKNCWESDMSVRSCKRQSISSRQETLEFPRGCFHAAGEGPWTDELALRDLRSTSLKQAPPPTAQLHSPVQKLQDGVRWHSPCPWSKPICSSSPSASKFSHKESPFQTSGLGLGWALSLCLSKAPLRRNLHVLPALYNSHIQCHWKWEASSLNRLFIAFQNIYRKQNKHTKSQSKFPN